MMLLGLVSLLFTSCTASTVPEPRETRLAYASNDLAFDLLKSYENQKNVFISPFSISTALAMLYLGAAGSTAQEMRRVLKYDQYGLSEQEIHETFETTLKRLEQSIQGFQFSSLNRVLVQNDFSIASAFEQALNQYYSAGIENVNFAKDGDQIKSKINRLVENATRGKIKDFLDEPPSSETLLFLLNAVYFLGNWENPFNSNFTLDRSFYNNGKEEKQVKMMHRDAQYRYAISEELPCSTLVIPYKGNNSASMVIVLPNENTSVSELQQKLNSDNLEKLLASTIERRIILMLPKFSLAFSADLVESLARMDLEELFTNSANLSRIAGRPLRVSKITHKAVIEVNERGSQATAATGIEVIPLSIPPTFRVDHPFLFFIRDNRSGMILFSGRVDEL